jgi:hypothetical protein
MSTEGLMPWDGPDELAEHRAAGLLAAEEDERVTSRDAKRIVASTGPSMTPVTVVSHNRAHCRKLADQQVAMIWASTASSVELAFIFKVSVSTILKVWHGTYANEVTSLLGPRGMSNGSPSIDSAVRRAAAQAAVAFSRKRREAKRAASKTRAAMKVEIARAQLSDLLDTYAARTAERRKRTRQKSSEMA